MNDKSLRGFGNSLFWDVNPEKLDAEKDAQFIIGRVLDFGDIEEIQVIKRIYGLAKIKQAALEHVFESPRSANFWELILNLPPKSLSCIRKRLPQIPSAFLNR